MILKSHYPYSRLIIVLISILGLGNTSTLGKYLGKFEYVMHQVQGPLYALDNGDLFIHRFYYDGEGPKGVIFIAVPKGENRYRKDQKLQVVNRDIDDDDIPEILNENVTLRLPRSTSLDKISKIVIWCPKYDVSFGTIDLTEDPGDEPDLSLQEVGSFIRTEHAVDGTVFIQDASTLVIRDFNYDGQGPSVYFFAGEEENLKTGKVIQYPYKKYTSILGPDKLKRTRRKDIVLRLPESLDAYKLKWLSVWCDVFEVSFGHVEF